MGLTNENTLIEVNKLFDLCFEANSLCDRIVYVSSIKFNMVKFADWFHHSIAHKFPLLADEIEEYGELRGDLFYRGMIPEQKQDYAKISDAMQAFALKVAELEKQCIKALHIAADNGDEGYEDVLRDFNITNISPMLKQATVFYNMAKDYESAGDAYKINKDFKAFIIPKFGGE